MLARIATEHPSSTRRGTCPSRPTTASPALAFGLAHEGGDSTDTVLATLIDPRTGIITRRRGDHGGRKARPRAGGGQPGSARGKELEPHEKEVLDFFDELIEGDTVPMSEMRDRIPEHSDIWRAKWESMTAALDSVG